MELSKSVAAVVTGGASGLGLATVKALRAHGVKVAIFDWNESTGVAAEQDTGAIFCKVDVSDDASVDAGFAKARAANGQERIMINCAGVGGGAARTARRGQDGTIKGFPLDGFNKIIQINLIGTFRCTVKSTMGMLTLEPNAGGERGVVVSTSSVAAQDGQVGQAAYSASKAAIVGMTLPIARDLAREGIRVNTIQPGMFDTPLGKDAPPEAKEKFRVQIPFPPRFGTPAEYASMVLEIVRNGYINGESIRLDAALRLSPQ